MTHHLVGMAEIAEILGVSRQRVAQLIESYEDFPKPEVELSGGRIWSRTAVETWILSHPERRPGPREAEDKEKRPRFFGSDSAPFFERFTDRARLSIVKAQEEARLLDHNYIGTEHILLGLLAVGEGVAYVALSSLAVRIEHVRGHVLAMIGRGTSTPEGHIPFTPRSKKVLQLALTEAISLGHNYIGTEHILLSIANEPEGVAWKALAAMGLGTAQVREKVLETLRGYEAGSLTPSKLEVRFPHQRASDKSQCSFCGKAQADVQKLIAGPGVYICNECVTLCDKIIDEQKAQVAESSDVVARLERLERAIKRLEEDS